MFPADCILLASYSEAGSVRNSFKASNPQDLVGRSLEDTQATEAYLNTKGLDGESNLKPKLPPKAMDKFMKSNYHNQEAQQNVLGSIKIQASAPAADLYTFKGRLECSGLNHFTMELDIKQFMHRGAILQNSNYVDAAVVYTGVNTKLVLNQGKYKFKIS
jgi:phospholipid-translocating ATPase